MTVHEINGMDRDAFQAAFGWIFEQSPWVVERAWKLRPFRDINALHRAMVQQVAAASLDEQLALLCAHPDLGTRARISNASTSEQVGAGLDRLTPDEFSRLQDLNSAYRTKFGFPFLLAVKGITKHDILRAIEERLPAAREAEIQEALRQVFRIAMFRLRDTLR